MDVLGQFLETRESEKDFPPLKDSEVSRLLKFDDWVFRKLREKIKWDWVGDETAQIRRINQARNYLERLVIALWRRGWLLDGKDLARHILAPISTIADYQAKGAIKEFWPYFCATVDRYVGVNSEEIQVEARRVGSTMGQVLAQLTPLLAKPQRSLPELVAQRAIEVEQAQTLREQQAKLKAERKEEAVPEKQLKLFG